MEQFIQSKEGRQVCAQKRILEAERKGGIMKKLGFYLLKYITCFLVIILIYGIAQWFLYPVKESRADAYAEKIGTICKKAETDGSLIYLCETGDGKQMVVLAENLWFPNRYRKYEVTGKKRLDVNSRKEYYQVFWDEAGIHIGEVTNVSGKNSSSVVFGMLLLPLFIIVSAENIRKRIKRKNG